MGWFPYKPGATLRGCHRFPCAAVGTLTPMITRTLHHLAVATLATVVIMVGAISARAGESNSGGYALNSEATPEEVAPRSRRS